MARLKRNAPLPRYVPLFKTLRAKADGERLKPNRRLPSERELGLCFVLSGVTMRQALADGFPRAIETAHLPHFSSSPQSCQF